MYSNIGSGDGISDIMRKHRVVRNGLNTKNLFLRMLCLVGLHKKVVYYEKNGRCFTCGYKVTHGDFYGW